MSDEQFMLRALEVSKQALPDCLPNPPVGYVLVKKGNIVAEGFTQRIGGNHVEVEAINRYSGELDNVTAYVTLEPCSFEGRTPSCARLLSSTPIERVVVSILDKDPRNSGKGIQILRDADIDVRVGVAETEVTKFITQFLGNS